MQNIFSPVSAPFAIKPLLALVLGFAIAASSLLGTDVAQGRLVCPLPRLRLKLPPMYYGCAPGTGRETQLFAEWLDGQAA